MQYSNIKKVVYQGHPILLLEIDGKHAEIPSEQKTTLFLNGFIFIQPEEEWSKLLPVVDYTIEGHSLLKLKGFLRSKALLQIIIEMN